MTQTPEANERNAHWQHHINTWQASDLSAADYCRQHQLTYHCFLYWRRKFASTAEPLPAGSSTHAQALSAFIAVPPQHIADVAAVNSADLHLCLPNGLEIRNIHDNNLGNVRSLLSYLS